MSSLCVVRSLSVESQEDFCSPTVDLGRDFEYLIRKCIAEKMAREAQVMSESFGDDQSEATVIAAASLDLPLDSEIENNTTEFAAPAAKKPEDKIDEKEPETLEETRVRIAQAECNPSDSGDMDVSGERSALEDATVPPNSPGRPAHDTNATENETVESIFADFEFPPLSKETTPTKKPQLLLAKTKPTLNRRKWKVLPEEDLSFNFSLLPHRPADADVTFDMELELDRFERELEVVQVNGDALDAKDNNRGAHGNNDAKTAARDPPNEGQEHEASQLWWDLEDELDLEVDLEDKVPHQVLAQLERFRDIGACKCLRNKLKRKYQKARVAIKSKLSKFRRIVNQPRGRKLYIHHRLHNGPFHMGSGGSFLPSRRLKDIDSKGFKFREELGGRKVRQYAHAQGHAAPAAPPAGRHYPRAEPVPAYALRANNADGAFENDLVNVLINLQNRDLTPEDYELLLRLDERVAPKTVTQNLLDSFKTDVVCESAVLGECAVCMEPYRGGQHRKHLPCGHVFHASCIDMWLENSSTNCPLDGLSVELC